jgi:hypothetical protein
MEVSPRAASYRRMEVRRDLAGLTRGRPAPFTRAFGII